MPEFHVLSGNEQPADPDNSIVLTEVMRPDREPEYTFTVLIDGKAVSAGGPFVDQVEAREQASAEADHYALGPIYVRREQA